MDKLTGILLLCFLFHSLQPTYGQEVDSFELVRSRFFQAGHYQFDGQGRLQVGYIQSVGNTNAIFFDDKSIRKEIELVKTQQAPYESAIKQWNKDFEKLQKKIADGVRNKSLTVEEIPKLRTECDDRAIRKLRDVLLPHQFAIVDEIHFRSLFRTHGLSFLLASEKLCKKLSISKDESRKLKSQYKQAIRSMGEDSLKIRDEIVAKILEPLTEPQRDTFFEKWDHLASKHRNSNVEELLVYMDPDLAKWANREQPPLKKLLSRPVFKSGPAGNLILQEQAKHFSEDLSVIVMFFGRGYTVNVAGISDEDAKVIREILQKPYQKPDADGKTVFAAPGGVSKESLKQCVVNIKDYLGEEGWANVERHATLINRKSAGPFYDLTEGDLSELLGLSDQQIDRIKSNMETARKTLIQKTNETESKILDQIFSAADPETKSKLKKLFGKPLKYTPANLGLISMMSLMEH